jgi:hypothetical protein
VAVFGLSSLLFAALIWALVRSLSSNVLLLVAETCCVMMLFLARDFFAAKPEKPKKSLEVSAARPRFYFPFVIYASALRIIIMVIVGYLFLVYLKTNYLGDDLTIASTFYTCLFSVLVVLFQMFMQERFFNWLGISGVLLIFPVFIVAVSAASLFFPTIPIIVVIIVITSLISLPLNAAKETLISTAPRTRQLRLRAQIMFSETILGDALIGSTALMVLGQGPFANRNLTFVIIVLGTIAFVMALLISRSFKEGLRRQVEQPRYLFLQANALMGELGPVTSDVAADAKRIAFKALKRGVRESVQGNVVKALAHESQRAVKYYNAFLSENVEHARLEFKARYNQSLERFLYLFAALCHDTRGVLSSIPKIQEQVFGHWDESEKASAIEYLDALAENATLRALLKDTLEVRGSDDGEIPPDDAWMARVKAIKEFEPKAHMTLDERILFLRRVNLFASISAEGLEAIASRLNENTVRAGETIFRQGEKPIAVSIVVTGHVAIQVEEREVSDVGPYELFGELAFLDDRPRSASAVAKTDGVQLSFEREDFQRLVREVPELVKALIHQLMGYLRKTEQYRS